MRFCVPVLAVLALLTGCGGDDGSSNKEGRASGSGYSVALPGGWSDVTDRPELAESPIRIDRLFTKRRKNGFATNVNVIREPAPEGAGLDDVKAQYERLLEGLGNRALTPPRDRQLDGEGAVGRDYMTRNRTQQRQVFSIHDGRIYTVTFTAPPGTFQAEQKEFEQTLGSWQWE